MLTTTYSLVVDDDYDVNARNPYAYKYNVEDPDTETSFEVRIIDKVSIFYLLPTRYLSLVTPTL